MKAFKVNYGQRNASLTNLVRLSTKKMAAIQDSLVSALFAMTLFNP
jgi:hypothetical protein